MRVIRNHGIDPAASGLRLDDRCVRGCWFELHRQGGCGPGELQLERGFTEDADLRPGDWVSVSTAIDDEEQRLYLGRVEHWEATYPAGVRVRLGGMVNELGEIFVGGFGGPGDRKPHRYGRTDLFTDDPDRAAQSYDYTARVSELLQKLVSQYILPHTSVTSLAPVQTAQDPPVDTMVFRGEESVRSVLKDLAVRVGNVDWGIDAAGGFFFRPGPTDVRCELRAGREITRLSQTRSRDVLFNRLQITGDYVYDRPPRSGAVARPAHRTRYHFVNDASLTAFGEHRLKLWLPWVRTRGDAESFAGRFFEQYGQPVTKTLVDAVLPAGTDLPLPWGGRVEVRDSDGGLLATGRPEAVRVQFDGAVTVRMEIGPEDPRRLWPEPKEDERYEVPPRSDGMSTDAPSSFDPSDPSLSGLPTSSDPAGDSSGGQSSGTSLWSLDSSGSEASTGSDVSSGSSDLPPSSAWTSWWSWQSSGEGSHQSSDGGSGSGPSGSTLSGGTQSGGSSAGDDSSNGGGTASGGTTYEASSSDGLTSSGSGGSSADPSSLGLSSSGLSSSGLSSEFSSSGLPGSSGGPSSPTDGTTGGSTGQTASSQQRSSGGQSSGSRSSSGPSSAVPSSSAASSGAPSSTGYSSTDPTSDVSGSGSSSAGGGSGTGGQSSAAAWSTQSSGGSGPSSHSSGPLSTGSGSTVGSQSSGSSESGPSPVTTFSSDGSSSGPGNGSLNPPGT